MGAQEGNEESVKLLLKGENEIIIEYLTKDYHENKSTALHYATKKGHKEIIKLLLNVFDDSEEKNAKLIEYLMRKNKKENTILHIASKKGQKEIVKLLLAAFGENENEKLIEYVMIENQEEETCLHLAIENERTGKEIVILLLSIFNEKKK